MKIRRERVLRESVDHRSLKEIIGILNSCTRGDNHYWRGPLYFIVTDIEDDSVLVDIWTEYGDSERTEQWSLRKYFGEVERVLINLYYDNCNLDRTVGRNYRMIGLDLEDIQYLIDLGVVLPSILN
jgi:hypothetical protein